MAYEPRSIDDVYESLRDSLTGRIARLTDFTERSFNYVWTRAFAEQVREVELQALAAQFNGWIDYAGKEVDDADLRELGLEDDVDPDEINDLLDDEFLDELVKIVGVRRFEGQRAAGSVTIETQAPQTTIPAGTRLTTAIDSSGETLAFVTTEQAETADGVTQVSDVPIQATDVGQEYNVPANSITRFESPPVGVRGVTNTAATTGGQDRESNEELRERAKKAVQASSEGGTTDGIKGYIRKNVEGVGANDIIIEEFPDEQPPRVDVIVDGGLDSAVSDAIETSRPTGIRHDLVRPQIVQVGLDTRILGDAVDTGEVTDDIESFLLTLGVGENLYEDELIREIMTSSSDIINIDTLGAFIERVTNEEFTYTAGQSDYRLDFTYESSNGSITVTDSGGTEYNDGVDFTVVDKSGDGYPETIRWSGATPADGQSFTASYDVTVPDVTPVDDIHDLELVRDERFTWNEQVTESEDYEVTQDVYQLGAVPFESSVSISDASGDTYTNGTDYEVIDETGNGFKQSIDWAVGGSTPDDNEVFTVEYTQKVYKTNYDIVETPNGVIRDANGNVYQEDTDYTLASTTPGVDTDNAIVWQSQPTGIDNGTVLYVSYLNEGDRTVDSQSKVNPGTVTVTEV